MYTEIWWENVSENTRYVLERKTQNWWVLTQHRVRWQVLLAVISLHGLQLQ
jgi:hypothetical protein